MDGGAEKKLADWLSLTKRELTLYCRKAKWKRYSHLNKAELVAFIMKKLQEHKPRAPAYRIMNDADFLTLEPIQSARIFKLRDPETRTEFQFHPKHLLQSILATGKGENPYTRKPLTALELEQLKREYLALNESPPLTFTLEGRDFPITANINLFNLTTELARQKDEERQLDELGARLELECTQVIEVMREIIQNTPPDHDIMRQIMMYLLNHHFPQLLDSFRPWAHMRREAAKTFWHQSTEAMMQLAKADNETPMVRAVAECVGVHFWRHGLQMFGLDEPPGLIQD